MGILRDQWEKRLPRIYRSQTQILSGSSDLVWAELAHTNVLGAGPCLVMAQGQKDKLVATVLIEVRDAKISEIAMCLIPTPAQCRRTGEYPK